MLSLKRSQLELFILVSLFLISIIPGVKYLGLMVQIFFFFYFFFKKRFVSLAVLLFSYSCYGTSVSVYSFKIIYALFAGLILLNTKNVIRFKFNKYFAYLIILFIAYGLFYGLVVNSYTQLFSFLVDFFTFLTFLGGFILFSSFTLDDCETLSLRMYLFWIGSSLFCIFFNYGFSSEVDFLGRKALLIVQGEAASIFYFILLYHLLFSKRNVLLRFFLFLIYVIINFKLGTFGSMLIMYFALLFGILVLMKFVCSKHKGLIVSIGIFIILSFAVLVNGLQSTEIGKKSEALSFKMKNITELFSNFSFIDRKKINLIPLSPYVRILEIINITHSSSPYSLLFGHGWGGFYNDNYYPFENKSVGKILGDADFPLEQRKSHIFTGTHNFGYPYLKYGLMYFVIVVLYIFYRFKCIRCYKEKRKIFYCAFVVVLAMYSYLGFTFQTALALGLLFSAYRNSTMPVRRRCYEH